MTDALKGLFAASVTPRRLGSQDINLGVTWELFDFLTQHQVDGIVLHGSTGEFLHFSSSERMRVMSLAPRRSRLPLLVNVSHSTLDGAIEMAQAAAASGAAGVLLMPPYFFRYEQPFLREFFLRFVDEARLNIPALLYHIPIFTSPIGLPLATELLAGGYYQGIKDSSGDPEYAAGLRALRERHGFVSFMGSDGLYARQRGAGLSGAVSGCASAVPELLVALHRALRAGESEIITRLEFRLGEFISWIDRFPVPAGVKEAACVRGLRVGPHSIPLSGGQEAMAAEFRSWFAAWLPDVQREARHA